MAASKKSIASLQKDLAATEKRIKATEELLRRYRESRKKLRAKIKETQAGELLGILEEREMSFEDARDILRTVSMQNEEDEQAERRDEECT